MNKLYHLLLTTYYLLRNKRFLLFTLCLPLILLTAYCIFPSLAHAAYTYTPMEPIPGFEGKGTDFPAYILNIYKFGIWTVGIAALLMISIGGFMYFTSAGNTAKLGQAKQVIYDAIFGLIIAMAAYLILNIINPDLVNVNISLKAVPAAPQAVSPQPTPPPKPGACPTPATTSSDCCPGGSVPCHDCTGCTEVTGITYKPCGKTPCFLESSLLSKLQSANSKVPFRVTETWPPTIYHASTCHQQGTCADVNTKDIGDKDVSHVKTLYDALIGAGLHPVYETYDCTTYTAAGVYCKYYPTMKSPSFHVNL